MFGRKNYFQTAKENETAFRNILRDLKENREQRPGGLYVPEDLEIEAEVQTIFEKYSAGDRYAKFTIQDFEVEGDIAVISFGDVAALSGGGAGLKYRIDGNTVEYLGEKFIFMSFAGR